LKYQTSLHSKEEEYTKELEKFKAQVDEEIATVKSNYEKLIQNVRDESKKEVHTIRQEYECRLIQKKREFVHFINLMTGLDIK
jgi:F0F1-type ATP synthase membrane subunit b/b'